jgi:DNA polymerase (family 10)
MDKESVATILEEIGTLLEVQGENRFRTQAYYNGARAIRQLEEDLAALIDEGRLADVPGIGKALQEKVTLLVRTGSLPFHEELKRKTSAGLLELLRLPGLGPRKVKAIYDELGIDDLEKLKQACEEGRVAALKGFGEKTQKKILEGVEFLGKVGQRIRLDQAEALAQDLIDGLRQCPGIIRMEVCGSLRRRKETINDIDILVSADDPSPIMDCFESLPGVAGLVGRGDTKCSVVVNIGLGSGRTARINADLRIVRDDQFPFALHYFTGSKDHNVAVRARAQQRGLKLNEYALAGDGRIIACRDEADLFRALGMDYVPPELREHTGEIDAASEHRLPALVELDDLQGTFHCHTDWTDGRATLDEMVEAARKRGLRYLGIADHSQNLAMANGLTPERVRQQLKEIDRVNERLKALRVLKGTECDILPDGSLDFNDEVLATFDYVVASVHSRFQMSREEMTARIVRALSNPYVTMLGHATGRLLLSREGYKLDLEAVLQAAARHGKMIEINSDPHRLDIDWVHCKRAKALGIKLVINPDAHSTDGLDLVRYGVDVARRGWLEKKDVFNTETVAQVSKELTARKERAARG